MLKKNHQMNLFRIPGRMEELHIGYGEVKEET